VTELSEQCDASHSVVQALVKKGLVVTESMKFERDPFESETFIEHKPLALNPEQLAVLRARPSRD
jgi:primosomal protein N'